MKWQFVELQKYKQAAMQFEEVVDLTDPLTTTFGNEILAVEPLKVKGYAQAEQDDIIVHAHVLTTIQTPSTRSGKTVTLDLDFEIDEIYINDEAHANRYEITDSVILIEDAVIDFDRALIEYVVLQVPLQVLAPGEEAQPMPAGEGWEVIAEEDYVEKDAEAPVDTNTPLAGLADLFKDED
ncbi:MAG: DUF177 domain-containing protein [Lactobacillaceae bacterium]|jgi:uncharacterized protein|nr:DUF177 domain-containing protein [Lactobacillaceae bacterium]